MRRFAWVMAVSLQSEDRFEPLEESLVRATDFIGLSLCLIDDFLSLFPAD